MKGHSKWGLGPWNLIPKIVKPCFVLGRPCTRKGIFSTHSLYYKKQWIITNTIELFRRYSNKLSKPAKMREEGKITRREECALEKLERLNNERRNSEEKQKIKISQNNIKESESISIKFRVNLKKQQRSMKLYNTLLKEVRWLTEK